MRKGIFITGTNTGIGKTVAACCIIRALKSKGIDCGVMKPVQCAGNDSRRLLKCLGRCEPIDLVNPFYVKYPYAPPVAFKKEKIRFDKRKVISAYKRLSQEHQFMVVEGAGGLLVPLTENYFISDLILDLGLPVVIVALAALGAINHTLLTVECARIRKIKIAGIIFNHLSRKSGIPEKTNPRLIKKLSGLPVLGVIPYLSSASGDKKIGRIKIDINRIIND